MHGKAALASVCVAVTLLGLVVAGCGKGYRQVVVIDGDKAEFVVTSLWASRDAIRVFAGDEIERAVFYPEDDRYLVDRETTVTHYEVVAGAG
jgi:heme-degrading monooxygenase HmoA